MCIIKILSIKSACTGVTGALLESPAFLQSTLVRLVNVVFGLQLQKTELAAIHHVFTKQNRCYFLEDDTSKNSFDSNRKYI